MSNTRRIDAEWFETTCPECKHVYLWHVDDHNKCTKCGADYGKLITDLTAYFAEIRRRIKRDYL